MGEQADNSQVKATGAGVVVGSGSRKYKLKLPSWKFGLVLVGVVVVALGAGVGVRYLQQYMAYKKASKVDAVTAKALDSQSLVVAGKYDEANKQLQDALKNPQLGNDQKFTLIFQQGTNYINQGKYDLALAEYKKAAALKQNQSVYDALARTAEQLGDKQAAIDYYRQAIAHILPTNRVADDDRASYQRKISELGGQP